MTTMKNKLRELSKVRSECVLGIICLLILLGFTNNRNLISYVLVNDKTNQVTLASSELADEYSTKIDEGTVRVQITLAVNNSKIPLHREVNELEETTYTNNIPRRNPRVLAGIFSADLVDEARYRSAFRELLQIHPKVCSLASYIADEKVHNGPCELIYTFVLGGNTNDDGPTEIVSNTSTYPILVLDKPNLQHSDNFDEHDITFLNIKENMNTGKSPTWFYYAGTLLDKYGFEYVMKLDTDSLLHLDRYFNFAESSLPPPPYNTRIIAGAAVDKAGWYKGRKPDARKESHFNDYYNAVHLYAAGQMYILSYDLVIGVAHVAANKQDTKVFSEGHEDHDVTTMAFLALIYDTDDKPLKFVMLPHVNSFWKHPTKLKNGVSNWKQQWDNETARIRSLTIDYNQHTNQQNETTTSTKLTNNNSSRTTLTITEIRAIDETQKSIWINHFENDNSSSTDEWTVHTKMLDAIQINNSIAPNNSCFLNTGYLQRPIEIVQLTAPITGGLQWKILVKFILEKVSNQTDVIILNGMDVGVGRSNNIHTVQLLAEILQMNFAWAATVVRLAKTTPGSEYGYTGPAILSKCPMYDPYLVREFNNQSSMIEWKILSADSGLFVRIASANTIATGIGYHIVAGSVSKLDSRKNRHMIWEYQFGYWPNDDYITGISPSNQLGSIIGGEMDTVQCIELFGLQEFESRRHLSFPATCYNKIYGKVRVDNICSNLKLPSPTLVNKEKSYTMHLPCYQFDQSNKSSIVQLSQHSVLYAALH